MVSGGINVKNQFHEEEFAGLNLSVGSNLQVEN